MSSSRIRTGLIASTLVAVALVVWWRVGEPVAPESQRSPTMPTMPTMPTTSVSETVAESSSPEPALGPVNSSSPMEPPTASLASASVEPDASAPAEAHARELALIDAAVVTYSVESLPSLAVYLTHADATVREAARDGFLQMGLTEGAAHLRAAADKTRDPREAVQLLDAADFLDLPSVPMTGGRELIPVSPQTRERMERERAAKKSGANSPR